MLEFELGTMIVGLSITVIAMGATVIGFGIFVYNQIATKKS